MQNDRPVILFVDDETSVLSALTRQFRRHREKWQMEFESSPRAALEKAKALNVDVVISDMKMPEINGLELIAAMRRFAPDSSYIMLTGSADLSTAVEAINDANVFRFYTKPCPAELLEEGIEAGLRSTAANTGNTDPKESYLSEITNSLGLAALDHLSLSVIVVDAAGRVLLTNKSGGKLLSAGDGLSMSAGEICRASNATISEKLHHLIKKAAADLPDDEHDSYVVAVERPSQKRAYSILAAPLKAPFSDDAEPLVALFVSDPDNQPLPSPSAISGLFGLTPAEARVVHELIKGSSLDEAANNAGVTVSTARTYLKQVFSKTNTNRQAELVKLVLTYPRLSNETALLHK